MPADNPRFVALQVRIRWHAPASEWSSGSWQRLPMHPSIAQSVTAQYPSALGAQSHVHAPLLGSRSAPPSSTSCPYGALHGGGSVEPT